MALCGRVAIEHGVDLPCHINDMKPTGSPKAAYDRGVVQSDQVSRCGSVLPTTTQGVAVRICLQTLQCLHPQYSPPRLLRSPASTQEHRRLDWSLPLLLFSGRQARYLDLSSHLLPLFLISSFLPSPIFFLLVPPTVALCYCRCAAASDMLDWLLLTCCSLVAD
jgi:hypothetical protein